MAKWARGEFGKMNEFIRKAVRFIDKEAGTNIESSIIVFFADKLQ